MGYFENVGLSNIDDLFTEISTRLVAAGATKTVLNNLSTEPSSAHVGRDELFKFNGTSSQPTAAYVMITRFNNTSFAVKGLAFSCFTAMKAPKTISTINQSGYTVTVVTSTNHGFTTGEVVVLNGTNNAALNEGQPGTSSSLSTITVVDPTTFTYQSDISQTQSGTGGTCFPAYNMASWRSARDSNYQALVAPSDTAMKIFGYVDEFHMVAVIVQGALFLPFFIGCTGRKQVPPNYADTGFTTGSVTGNGATPSTIDLDRSCTNLRVGQKVWLISPTTAAAELVTIATHPTGTQITAIVSNGTNYPAGSLVGEDPMPVMVMGGGTTTQDLSSKTFYASFYPDATRGLYVGSNNYVAKVEADSTNEVACDPIAGSGRYSGKYVNLYSPGTKDDDKGRIVGLVAWAIGAQSDLDRMKVGESDPADYYKIFITQRCDSNWAFSVGPGATA